MFQSFPFVGLVNEAFASCRDFVRYRLPEVQDSSPKLLGNVCEARLGDDIDNDNVLVVGGDGTETCAGRHGVQERMESQDDIDTELSSWTCSRPGHDVEMTRTKSVGAELDSVKGPSLRRIKSTLSALVTEPSLLTMAEESEPCMPPRLGKTRSSTNITSFVEQLSLSSNNCIMPPKAQLNHKFSSVARFNQGDV